MRVQRPVLSLLTIILFAVPLWSFGNMAWTALPRESCGWREEDFCSDYGPFYATFAGIILLAMMILLWAINRTGRE